MYGHFIDSAQISRNRYKMKLKFEDRYKWDIRVESKSSLDNIDGIVVLGLQPCIITSSYCLIDLHLDLDQRIRLDGVQKENRKTKRSRNWVWFLCSRQYFLSFLNHQFSITHERFNSQEQYWLPYDAKTNEVSMNIQMQMNKFTFHD